MVALFAALVIGLNILLPVVAKAVAFDASYPVVICTPEGHKTLRLNQNGEPLPAQKKHDCPGCAVHHGFGGFAALIPTIDDASAPDSQSAVRPERASQRSADTGHNSDPRGPPDLS